MDGAAAQQHSVGTANELQQSRLLYHLPWTGRPAAQLASTHAGTSFVTMCSSIMPLLPLSRCSEVAAHQWRERQGERASGGDVSRG